MKKRLNCGKRLRMLWIVLAVIMVVGLAEAGIVWGAYHRYIRLPETLQGKVDLLPDAAAQEGTPGAAQAEETLESGSFRVVINQMMIMENGESPCNIWAENPEENPYDLRVCLYLQETGELLGATHLIQRGKRVDDIYLDQVLPAGEYSVIAQLEMFDDSLEPVNQLSLNVSLLVRE